MNDRIIEVAARFFGSLVGLLFLIAYVSVVVLVFAHIFYSLIWR